MLFWVIGADRMKMERPHIVPLPRQAVAILRELFMLATAENKKFVFPGMNKQTENGTLNENTLLAALEKIGYKGTMYTAVSFSWHPTSIISASGCALELRLPEQQRLS